MTGKPPAQLGYAMLYWPLRCLTLTLTLTLLLPPVNARRGQEYHSCQDTDSASCDTKIVLNSRGDRQLSLQSVKKGKYP
jgi:hypothetical protein